MDPGGSPLGRNLTQGLVDVIGKRIVIGGYDAGFPIEAEIAREFGVSRATTREAVKMLSAKGLLGARPRQGTYVETQNKWNLLDADVLRWLLERKHSPTLLLQFSELRLAIEPAAASLAAKVASPPALAVIDAAIGRMAAAERGEDDPLESDIAFHLAVLDAAGNPFFGQLRHLVATALRVSIRLTNRIQGHAADVSAHDAVRRAIAAGSARRAETAMRKIIEDVQSLIQRSG